MKRIVQPIGWGILFVAFYVTAFLGWIMFMPFYWFALMMDFTDESFKSYCQFWFDGEYLG